MPPNPSRVKIALSPVRSDDAVLVLRGALPPQSKAVTLRYHTNTGALVRVDETAIGAYDREHREIVVEPADQQRQLDLEVELQSLPTNGLPAGRGLVWWWLNARSHETPRRYITVTPSNGGSRITDEFAGADPLALIGHSHLDVAWLWTYEQTVRKAQRTFAIACDLCDRDSHFRFVQSQPQLYRFVEESDPALFERVRDRVDSKRFDPDVAALWVESDCNLPSGESLLRQMLFAHRYCEDRFGVTPSIAWLPDSFGFANTLPQLLAHARIPFFATTKLQWNDTTRFPFPQFVWRGPDGSTVTAALIQSYDGPAYPWRVRTAKKRNEPLVLGYGDGGGGVTTAMLTDAPRLGKWIRPRGWFERLQTRDDLPIHTGELYLEYHRGVYTTHHDVKFHNALLERALTEAEELAAWCVAVHAPPAATRQFAGRLHSAWEIVLRNQFHDVLPGTSIGAVYDDVAREFAQAQEMVAAVISSAQTILPRAPAVAVRSTVTPVREGSAFRLDNDVVSALIGEDGTLTELRAHGGPRLRARANMLALYRDRPRRWEAWNIDDGYQRTQQLVNGRDGRVEDSAVLVDFFLGRSPAAMKIELRADEPFLRFSLMVDWRERRRLLRLENEFAMASDRVLYGSPHGTIERSALRDTPERRAKFEVPGQRFAAARDANGCGVAILSLDTYGWSAAVQPGGIAIGHSLLRGTTWPDANADRGEHAILYAFLPMNGMRAGRIEDAWLRFAHEPRVRLFRSDDDAVFVAACKPAEDGAGVIVRVRECDGEPRSVQLRCGARMTGVIAVDALERPVDDDVRIEGEALGFDLGAFQIRSFRVRFGT